MDYMKALLEFHKAFDHPINDKPTAFVSDEVLNLRRRLMTEELMGSGELIESMVIKDLVGIADGLADLLYVVFGTAVSYGIPMDQVFGIVHKANMAKLPDCENCQGVGRYAITVPAYHGDKTPLGIEEVVCTSCNGTGKGPPLKDAGGKTIKPPGWVGPEEEIRKLLEGMR